MNRSSQLNIFVGFPGTGKSTLIQKFIDIEVQKRDGRVLIVVPDPFEWKQYPEFHQGIDSFHNMTSPHKIVYQSGTIEAISDEHTGFYNGLLIFEDCRYYTRAKIQDALHKLIIRRRHRSIDIIAAAHGITEVPPVFITFVNRISLFYTQDNPIKRKLELGNNLDSFIAAQSDVNAQYKDNPHFFKVINVQ